MGMTVKNHLSGKVFILTAFSVLAAFFTYFVDAWIGQHLGPETYGDFKVILRFFHLLGHIGLLGQDLICVMLGSRYSKDGQWGCFRGLLTWITRVYLKRSLIFYGTLFLLVIIYQYRSDIFHGMLIHMTHPGFNQSFLFLLCVLPCLWASSLFEKYFVYKRYFYYAITPRMLLLPAVMWVGGTLFISSWTLNAAVTVYGVSFMVLMLIGLGMYGACREKVTERAVFKINEWWRISLQFYATTLVITSGRSLTLFLLELLGQDEKSVGYFAATSSIIVIFHLMVKPLESFLRPYVSSLLHDDRTQFHQVLVACNRLRYALCIIYFAVLMFAPSFILSFYGQAFKPALSPMLLMAFCFLIYTLGQPNLDVLSFGGFQKESMWCVWGQIFLSICLSVALMPAYGVWGAVIADGVSMALLVIVASILAQKKCGIHTWFVLR